MQKKALILQAAEKLFAEKGYRETSILDICQMTGVAEGTIFYHFKNKEWLFLTVFERIVHDIIGTMREFSTSNGWSNGLEELEAVISYYLCMTGELGSRYILLHRHDIYELARINERCREVLSELYGFLLEMFEKPLNRGVADGSIRDLSPARTSFILFALLDGIARLQTFNLYESGSLYSDVLNACRQIIRNNRE